MAIAPLVRVAQEGTPVYLVPGNHERSRIPLHLWAAHPNLHIFHQPQTFLCAVEGGILALAGFPFARRARHQFGHLVRESGYHKVRADARVLCLHQSVEGAQVGTHDYTFRRGQDVVRGSEIPGGFCAVLSGHIHRAQVLTQDLSHRPLAAPVIYPGAVERTSFDERHEPKGYTILSIGLADPPRGQLLDVAFVSLPTRPMALLAVDVGELGRETLADHLRRRLSEMDPDAIVRVQLRGRGAEAARAALTAARLRALAPPTMNITLPPERRERESGRRF
jgi:DNA repair exonuclease SbcCD nuclease subunit